MLYHLLCDSQTGFLIKTELRTTKQFMKPAHYRVQGLVLDFLREFEKSYVLCVMDNYFNSYELTQKCNEKKILIFGTIRKNMIARYFDGHENKIHGYIESKNSRNHHLKAFSASIYDHPTRGRVHVQVYNSPFRNAVLLITNSNTVLGKSDQVFSDYRDFRGGHFSRSFQDNRSRPYTSKIYNDNMGGVDSFDQYLHRYTLRYIPLKNNLSFILHPILSVFDYQILNCFMLHREMHTNPTDYKVFLLRIAQGFCSQSKKPSFAPLRVRNRSFSRAKCRSCSDSNPYRDSRTSKFCDRCGDACCTNHAKHICQSCFE